MSISKAKPRGRAFAKGHSGNLKGRPKATPSERNWLMEVRKLTQEAGPESVAKLIEIMRGTVKISNKVIPVPVMAQLAAATSLLDRGFGRPAQSVDVNANLLTTVRMESVVELLESRTDSIRERLREQGLLQIPESRTSQ